MRCNFIDDCLDGSDEIGCTDFLSYKLGAYHRLPPPVHIDMDGAGDFRATKLTLSDLSCPETHFTCPGHDVYCLPIYVRCNGVPDCPQGQDEVCDDVMCSGLYTCRSSSVCLHLDHVCDGIPQCPERDDEHLCDLQCPLLCTCIGLSFVCNNIFNNTENLNVRYIDITDSNNVTMNYFNDFHYLIFLKLHKCGIESLNGLSLPNLRTLDLSYNNISTLNTSFLYNIENLKELSLHSNPLTLIVYDSTDSKHSLSKLDLSSSKIQVLSYISFTGIGEIKQLNLSFSALENITFETMSMLKNLTSVDLTGCQLKTFSKNLFVKNLALLDVYSNDFRLCCKEMLPAGFNIDFCHTDSHWLSSCNSLLKNSAIQSVTWCVGVLAMFMNATGLCYVILYIDTRNRDNIIDINLNILGMTQSLLLLTIVCADEVLVPYFRLESIWRNGVVCDFSKVIADFSIMINILLSFAMLTNYQGHKLKVLFIFMWSFGILFGVVLHIRLESSWIENYLDTACLGIFVMKSLSSVVYFTVIILVIVCMVVLYVFHIMNYDYNHNQILFLDKYLAVVIINILIISPFVLSALLNSFDIFRRLEFILLYKFISLHCLPISNPVLVYDIRLKHLSKERQRVRLQQIIKNSLRDKFH